MALTPTAKRILDTLPDYHWENPIILRVVQARANEIDRMDAMIDTIKLGMIPGAGDDTLRLLSVWEAILGLPVAPATATVALRQIAVQAALKRLNAVTAADVLELLTAQLGASFSIDRDTPALLQDTLNLDYASNSYQAAIVRQIVGAIWPAHRQLLFHYAGGFLLDSSQLDTDTF